MKQLKILGVTVASYGEAPPKAKDAYAEEDTNRGRPPGQQDRFLSPRYEPSNITANADVAALQNAIRQAENGQTLDLFRFYRDIVLSDDHVQSCFNTRKLALLAQPLAILPKDKHNPDDQQLAQALTQAKDDCENWLPGMLALLDGALWPNAIVERIYKPAGPVAVGGVPLQYTLRKFIPVNPQLHCYQWAYMMSGTGLGTASAVQLAGLDTKSRPGMPAYTIDLEQWEPYLKLWPVDNAGRIIYDVSHASYLDPARHIVHRGHLMQTFRDNWGGPLRAVAMWWLFRGLGRGWFAQGMERYGSPFPVGYTDANDPVAVGLLREAFDLAKKIGGLVVDERSRIELKEAVTAGMAQGYETFFNLCNEAISFHITGLRSSQKPAGLNAGENNFVSSVREDVRMMDAMLLSETCWRQLAVPFRDLNGLKGCVKFMWGGLSDADAKTFADLLKTMRDAGFTPSEESLPTINDRTGISWSSLPTASLPTATGTPPGADAPGDKPGAASGEDDADPDADGDADGDTDGDGDGDDKDGGDGDEPKPLSAKKLAWLSAQSRAGHAPSPVAAVVQAHAAALGKAFRGGLAPVRQIILNSSSRADAERQLKTFFADWPAERIAGIVEEAMQVCAAKGAADGQTQ